MQKFIGKVQKLFLVLLIVGCSPTAEQENVFVTTTDDRIYTSDFFALEVAKPEGWVALDEDTTNDLMNIGTDMVSYGNDDLKRALKASEKQSVSVFSFFKYEVGAPVDSNPNVISVGENVKFVPGVKTGKDYFFHVKKLFAQTGMDVKYLGDYKSRVIGGVIFDQLDTEMSFAGAQIYQSYYAARRGGHILGIIQTYSNDAEKAETDVIIDSIKLQ